LEAQSGLLAAIVSVAVAISVLLRARTGLLSTLFTLFAANLFVHYLAAFLHNLAGQAIWRQIDLIAATFLPVTSLLFFGYFLWQKPELPNRYLRVAYAVTGLLMVFLLTPWSTNQLTTVFVLIYAFTGLYLCAWLIHVRYQELDSNRDRTRLRYLLIFHLVALTFVLLGMLPGPLGFLRTWGNLVSVFFLYFVSQSLLKYHLLDLQELLGRTLVLTAVALILALVFGVLVLWAGGAPEVSLFHTFVASIVILILFEPLRDQVESSTRRLFFRERYDLRRKLEAMRREIANILDPERMTRVLLDRPYDSLRISHANVYLQAEGGASYRLLDNRGPDPVERIDLAAHKAFFDQLNKTPTAVLAETFERQVTDQGAPADSEPAGDAERARTRSVLETLAAMRAGICIPLVGHDEILGFWNLHDETGLETFSAEEIALLMVIGEQAAINIENSRVFARIRERDRLAVLGEMSAGLAHEIRNPLGAIKGAAQYLDPSAVGADAAEFLNIIIEETDRLNKVVDQFLDYARPYHAKHQPTHLNRVLEHTLKLATPGLQENGIELNKDLKPGLPRIQANVQQLTQVFLNLLTNAIEAMPAGGTLTVRSQLRQPIPVPWISRERSAGTVQVEITDTGIGIAPEKIGNIFVPFFTTKERGTGLGLAISQRIIESHGGEIRIRSKQGEGATFLVVFSQPVVDEPAKADSPTEENEPLKEKPSAAEEP
jgi:two-component system sensor histidine kinase HydH